MHSGGGHGTGPKKARIEIVPLIDVMFFLLASFMMVSLSLQKSQTVKVSLPPAATAMTDFKPDVLNIGITRNGTAYIGTNAVELARLDEALKKAWGRNGTNAPVFITADEQARHGDVTAVLRHVRQAGFQKVSFIATGDGRPVSPVVDPKPAPQAKPTQP